MMNMSAARNRRMTPKQEAAFHATINAASAAKTYAIHKMRAAVDVVRVYPVDGSTDWEALVQDLNTEARHTVYLRRTGATTFEGVSHVVAD